jgi:hypothetical protein
VSVGRQPRWTQQQDALLRKMWPYAEMRSMVWVLRRTKCALKNRAYQLGLHNRYANRKPYSATELRMLRKHFPHMSSFKVVKRLKRSVCSVNGMAAKFRLHKTTKYLASPDACRLRRGDNIGAAHRFPPGHVPANKGLRRPGWAPGRMAETQFKKGQRSRNYLPVGTVRADSDGYLRKKIADHGLGGFGNQKVWEFVHIRVWTDAHGPVPDGHVVIFKDRNKGNVKLENLKLLTRAELMRRNTIHNLPVELRDTIMLAGRLKRIIRRKTREAIEEGLHGARHQGAA